MADGVDQHVAVRGQRRLHDAPPGPRVFPEHLAGGRRDTGRAGPAHEHDLLDAVDRDQMR